MNTDKKQQTASLPTLMDKEDFVIQYKRQAGDLIYKTNTTRLFSDLLEDIRTGVYSLTNGFHTWHDLSDPIVFDRDQHIQAIDKVFKDDFVLTESEYEKGILKIYGPGNHLFDVYYHDGFPGIHFTPAGMMWKSVVDKRKNTVFFPKSR